MGARVPTDRELQILRMMHGGVKLLSVTRSSAQLVLQGSTTVTSAVVSSLESSGWLTFDSTSARWQLTEAGRDMVRVRDDVSRYLTEQESDASHT